MSESINYNVIDDSADVNTGHDWKLVVTTLNHSLRNSRFVQTSSDL